jgi:hypothetical protein
MLLGIFLLLEKRNKLVDFPYPWVKSSAALMIPSPKAEDPKRNQWNRLDAVYKPFQSQVINNIYGYNSCYDKDVRSF